MTTDVINGVPRELLPCPLCGGDVQFHKDEECDDCHFIQCGQCKAFFDFATGADPENNCCSVDSLRVAIVPLWNRRALLATAQPAADGERGAVEAQIVGRYTVQPTGRGFWPYCVRAGDGTRELFIGHKTKCEQVAAALQSACLDGAFMQARAAQPAKAGWRDHSVNYAKGEKPPQTIETLQAAWDRDQELLLEQKAEIAKLKEKLNQERQKLPAKAVAVTDEVRRLREALELLVNTHDEGGWPSAAIVIARATLSDHKTGEEE